MQAFPGEPTSIAEARHFVAALLIGWPCAEDARLVVSELATNAVLHTASGRGGRFIVVVQVRSDRVRVGVKDAGARHDPVLHADAANRSALNGRGLFLVAALAKEWGVEGTRDGRVVWAEFARDAAC
ncbi:ATP-binding protein [Yinghuangia sp. YIM S10712]|uniref:ATP-binding protein n=1 Tax=Yinghuangia sp. YIM S10712 TaxID=3436930 RepID=UPI003F53B3C7